MDYEKYLQTETWRRTRDAKLRSVHYRCERCGTKTQLEVHHRHYYSLGHEQPADLEALCRNCHEQHHVEREQDSLGIYFKIITEVVREKLADHVRFDSIADLTADVKDRLAKRRIRYDDDKLTRAMSLMGDGRLGTRSAQVAKQKVFRRDSDEPSTYWPTQAEAIAILRQLGAFRAIKTMEAEPAARIVDRDRTDYDADDPRIYRE